MLGTTRYSHTDTADHINTDTYPSDWLNTYTNTDFASYCDPHANNESFCFANPNATNVRWELSKYHFVTDITEVWR